MILVSPTEPAELRAIGETSPSPEWVGADVLVSSPSGSVWAVQRKRVPEDLGASLADGRLVEQLARAADLEVAERLLILEGSLSWAGWPTMEQVLGVLLSVQVTHGWRVAWTAGLPTTCAAIRQLESWIARPAHDSLRSRPGPRGEWGRATNHEWLAHLLMGFEGVGPRKAAAILEECAGRPPLSWAIDEARLERAVGPALARRLTVALLPPAEEAAR